MTQRAENPHLSAIRESVTAAPTGPGVYRWLGHDRAVLYVGKAKNIRSRLRSYMQKDSKDLGPWKQAMMREVEDVEVTVTNTELEALVLETNQIKDLRPKYNVMMKDDKNYVYLRVTVEDPYPRVEVTRRIDDRRSKYFGPFMSSRNLHHTLDLLQQVLNYRESTEGLDRLNRAFEKGEDTSKGVPVSSALAQQIGQSCGVAQGDISREEYLSRIDALVQFFHGNHGMVTAEAQELMKQAATEKKFERAAKIRDGLAAVESMREAQLVSDTSGEDIDTIGIVVENGRALAVVLRQRDGRVVGERSVELKGEPDSVAEALREFLPQYVESLPAPPTCIVIGEEVEDRPLLEAWIAEQFGKKTEIRVPERGKKSQLLKLAETNARQKLQQTEARWAAAARNIEQALTELQQQLKLETELKRIEGYDISHLGGTETVGSMVVMVKGKPANDQYRSFTIRTVKEGEVDDYKALAEVLRRRLKYLTQDVRREEASMKENGILVGKLRKAEQEPFLKKIEENTSIYDPPLPTAKEFLIARKEKDIVACAALRKLKDGALELTAVWAEKKEKSNRLEQFLCRKLLAGITKGKVYAVIQPAMQERYAELGFRHIHTPPESIAELIEGESIPVMYEAKEHKPDKSLQTKPDLLVIDGGKGQLNAALAVLQEMNLNIPVIGLAKREEEVFVPGERFPLPLAKESQASFLLQRLRNEAHRFANRHREKRLQSRAVGSALDAVPGIGPKTKKLLLEKLGSVEQVRQASDKELSRYLTSAQLQAVRENLLRE